MGRKTSVVNLVKPRKVESGWRSTGVHCKTLLTSHHGGGNSAETLAQSDVIKSNKD